MAVLHVSSGGIAEEQQDHKTLCKKYHLAASETISGIGHSWGENSNETLPCIRFNRLHKRQIGKRYLIGSFEESLLSGCLSFCKINQRIGGFLAVLNVVGGSFLCQALKLPFSVTSVDGENYLLYYSSIDLEERLLLEKHDSQNMKTSDENDDQQAGGRGVLIPMKGQIQLAIVNPESTPIHVFFCNYDLSDMPAGTKSRQTFLRQKITLCSSKSTFMMSNASKMQSQNQCDGHSHHQVGFGNSNVPDSVDIACSSNEPKSSGWTNAGTKDNNPVSLGVLVKKSTRSSMPINRNDSESGVLRYALQLHFLCLLNQKHSRSIKRCRSSIVSTPSENGISMDMDRLFYLNNIVRVVFPQRHPDADEGKLHVEYEYPSDPRYFDI